jgi:hypothetical protein
VSYSSQQKSSKRAQQLEGEIMKALKIAIITSILTIASNLIAAEVLPTYPNVACDKDVCASVTLNRSGEIAQINVNKASGFLEGRVVAVFLLNGEEIGSTVATRSRGGLGAHLEVKDLAHGNLEIYFVNNFGQYDSDFGRNFQFGL